MSSTTMFEQALWFLHNRAVIHARSDQTDGTYAVVEVTGAPGDAPPLHMHTYDDEGFYLLEGSLRLDVGGDPAVHLRGGQFALAPHGIPHVYVVESEQPARWLAITNGGFDRFVEEIGVPAQSDGLPPEPHMPAHEELLAIAQGHGIVILGPPGQLPA